MKKVYLVEAVRTAIGKFGGTLRNINAEDLATIVIKEALKRKNLDPNLVESVIVGQTRQSTKANNLARVSSLKAGISLDAKAYTINMLCGSGMKSIGLGAWEIISGEADIVVAGGTENMSQTPYYIRNARFGDRPVEFVDGNLEGGVGAVPREIYGNSLGMGITAENVAERYEISREEQDLFAYKSQQKYKKAKEEGLFKDEIVSVEIPQRKGDPIIFDEDEFPRPNTTLEKLGTLKTVFKKNGTVTAGNACGRNDGASAVILMSEKKVKELDIKPIAEFIDCSETGVDPRVMGIGPIPATRKILNKTNIKLEDIGLIELNEAFASQSIACIRELGLNEDIININGGAIALGHPLGCTGARIVTTLVYNMRRLNIQYGLATQCIGGGQGIASIWKLV